MAASFVRSLRKSSAGAWLLLALTVLVPLVAVYLLALQGTGPWVGTCTPNLPFKGEIEIPCSKLRVASLVVSAAGAFLVVVLIWWLLTELIGLRRIFEVPWFGVGEDVENVGVVESIVRAGLFVVVVWVAFALSVLAYIGMSGGAFERPVDKGTHDTSSRLPVELAPLVTAADKLTGEVKGIRDQLAGRPTAGGPDPGIVEQLQPLGERLRDIQAILRSQDRKLEGLRQIDDRLTRWERERNDGAILDEAKRVSGALGEVRTLLDTQGRRLGTLDETERLLRDLDVKQVPAVAGEIAQLTTAIGDVQNIARTQVDLLERVVRLINQRSDMPGKPPDLASCFDPGGAAAPAVSVTAPRHYRRTLRVFFDKSGRLPTPGALESLHQFADELRRVDQVAVSIFGSADAQGDPGLSAQYAEQRAQIVKQFLKFAMPQLDVRTSSARSADEPPSEPYNRVARVEAQGMCR